MNRLLAICILTCCFQTAVAQFSSSKQEAFDIALKAVDKMNEGNYEEAITLLELSEELDPKNVNYPYEKAYAYYALKDYERSIDIIEGIIDHKDANDQFYQLLGNSYDFLGDTPKAVEIYNKGLDRFPKSGRLYFEMGTVSYSQKAYDDAKLYWEKGVVAEPEFPSNYYWLSKLYQKSAQKLNAVLCAEVFINIEKNTDRTFEMSKLLYDSYNQAIEISENDSAKLHFAKDKTIDPSQGFKIPFPMTYELTAAMSIPYTHLEENNTMGIAFLHELRKSFIDNWVKHKRNKSFPNALFEFHQNIIEAGHFEAYNYWALLKGNEDEFWDWYYENEAKYKAFVKWFETNSISFNEKNIVLK